MEDTPDISIKPEYNIPAIGFIPNKKTKKYENKSIVMRVGTRHKSMLIELAGYYEIKRISDVVRSLIELSYKAISNQSVCSKQKATIRHANNTEYFNMRISPKQRKMLQKIADFYNIDSKSEVVRILIELSYNKMKNKQID